MRRTALAVWSTTFLLSAGLAAQAPWVVDIGRRVRVTTDSGTVIGTLVGQDSGGVQVRWPGTPDSLGATIPRHRILRLDVSGGHVSNAGKGAAIGLGVGATLGLVTGIGCASSQDSFFQCTTGDVVQLTFMSGLFGAGVGALIGLASTHERWESVFTRGDVRVSLAPHGLGVGVSIAF
jgi:hypothetical protein